MLKEYDLDTKAGIEELSQDFNGELQKLCGETGLYLRYNRTFDLVCEMYNIENNEKIAESYNEDLFHWSFVNKSSSAIEFILGLNSLLSEYNMTYCFYETGIDFYDTGCTCDMLALNTRLDYDIPLEFYDIEPTEKDEKNAFIELESKIHDFKQSAQ